MEILRKKNPGRTRVYFEPEALFAIFVCGSVPLYLRVRQRDTQAGPLLTEKEQQVLPTSVHRRPGSFHSQQRPETSSVR
jgi:hypothetical protein